MAESFNLLRRVGNFDTSMELPAYSGVVIFAGQDEQGNNIEYRAGNQNGTLLEITNEWGSQAQADAIYKKIRGYRYQPYKASGTHIDPSAEIGDAVTIADTYGGVFLRATTYGRDVISDLEAPSKEEVEHEFQIQSPTNRQYARFTRSVRSTLTIQATQIKAKVEKTEGDKSSDFWWDLQSDGWNVGSGKNTIFSVKKGGAYVNGEIRATSGKIGGFDIKSNYLSYNGQTWGGTNAKGAYIGSSGIQLGKNFKVDMSGNLTAASGRFEGTVYAGNISYGGDAGYFDGGGLDSGTVSGSKIAASTLGTSKFTSGVTTSLGYADFAHNVFKGYSTADVIGAGRICLGDNWLGTETIHYLDSGGNSRTLNAVTWR